jgi:hypothetical protein
MSPSVVSISKMWHSYDTIYIKIDTLIFDFYLVLEVSDRIFWLFFVVSEKIAKYISAINLC